MRVYFIFNKKLYPVDECSIVDMGFRAWFNDDLIKATNHLKKKNFRKPQAIIIDGESFKDGKKLAFQLIKEQLVEIRQVCPDSEILFLSVGIVPRDFKKALSTINVQNIKKRRFNEIQFCEQLKASLEKDREERLQQNNKLNDAIVKDVESYEEAVEDEELEEEIEDAESDEEAAEDEEADEETEDAESDEEAAEDEELEEEIEDVESYEEAVEDEELEEETEYAESDEEAVEDEEVEEEAEYVESDEEAVEDEEVEEEAEYVESDEEAVEDEELEEEIEDVESDEEIVEDEDSENEKEDIQLADEIMETEGLENGIKNIERDEAMLEDGELDEAEKEIVELDDEAESNSEVETVESDEEILAPDFEQQGDTTMEKMQKNENSIGKYKLKGVKNLKDLTKHQTDNKIKVLQADGYDKYTEPLKMLKGVKLVGRALKREEVVEKFKNLRPDIVTLSPDLKGDTDMLEIVHEMSGKARIIFINPSKLPQIDRRMLLEYNVEFLDYLTIGALEIQIKKDSSNDFKLKKVGIENALPISQLKYKKIPNVIGVASVKSAGKTMVAVNLAVKLAEAGNLTVLLDLTEDQDINIWMKVEGNKEGLTKVFRGAANIEKIAWIPYRLNLDNLLVLTGDPSVYRITYERKALGMVLKKLSEFADYVVVDLPNGFQSIQSDAVMRNAGRVFIVTDDGPARVKRTANAINTLAKRFIGLDKFTIIFNNVSDDYIEQANYIRKETGLGVSFILPSRPIDINNSIKNGEPICLYDSEFSNKFTELYDFIEENI